MFLEYKSPLGDVILNGKGAQYLRTTEIRGIGPAEKEYTVAVFGNYHGQKTLNSRALPRCITLSAELKARELTSAADNVFRILQQPGYLYIGEKSPEKRIYCTQITIPDPTRILRGRIAKFEVQFVCDNPYFQDAERSHCYLYSRIPALSTPFTLPGVFGTTVAQTEVENLGDISSEPLIRILCSEDSGESQSIRITNHTTGKEIVLTCGGVKGEEILIDIPLRKIRGSIRGDMLKYLDNDSFLGDFVLVPGINNVTVTVDDVTSGFGVECLFYGLHSGAVIL